jgi:hypothetical protein
VDSRGNCTLPAYEYALYALTKDAAIAAGKLTWTELAQVRFKSKVAENHGLGPFNPSNDSTTRKKSKTSVKMEGSGDSSFVDSGGGLLENDLLDREVKSYPLQIPASSKAIIEDDIMAAAYALAPCLAKKLRLSAV